jgi:nucleotidyltransferase/DNA polymerase involved in DNA repair
VTVYRWLDGSTSVPIVVELLLRLMVRRGIRPAEVTASRHGATRAPPCLRAAQDALLPIIDKVWRHCETSGTRGRTVTLKIKYKDFQQIARSVSSPGLIEERTAVERIALDLLKEQFPVAKGIRLLGISFSALAGTDLAAAEQLPLGI